MSRKATMKERLNPREELIGELGGECVRCGTRDVELLQIDHIYDDGAEERKTLAGATMVRYYLQHPDEAKKNLQVLCANHNWKKRYVKRHRSKQSKEALGRLMKSPMWNPFDEKELKKLDGEDMIRLYEYLNEIYEPYRSQRRRQLVEFDFKTHGTDSENLGLACI